MVISDTLEMIVKSRLPLNVIMIIQHVGQSLCQMLIRNHRLGRVCHEWQIVECSAD